MNPNIFGALFSAISQVKIKNWEIKSDKHLKIK